jgi:hypothetical protein
MIRVNLAPRVELHIETALPWPDLGFHDFPLYLLSDAVFHSPGFPHSESVINFRSSQHCTESEAGSMPPELRESLLGKSPLRLVLSRRITQPNVWLETLECGHEVTAYLGFLWDEKSHLVNLPPTAKRRRCQECKALALASPKKPVQSVRSDKKERAA